MKKIKYIISVIGFLFYSIQINAQPTDIRYLNESPPGTTPKVFAPGKVSTENEFEFGAVFSNDNNTFYYGVEINGKAETRMMKFENGSWNQPVKILFHEVYNYNDPFLTPDNKKLFFISDRPLTGIGPKKDYDIWFIEQQDGKWSEPKNAGKNINSSKNEYYISFTKTGKIYFSSNREDHENKNNYDIYSSELKNGEFQPSIKSSPQINTAFYEADVFVAPDESYIVFAANRPGGLGSGDLYVSFRKQDGTWTSSKSLGNAINTETDDFCPYVTADGSYLFYASRGDIYWVSTDVIKKLR
ncbi:TolB family protein [Ohtaekwangia koreensis]|uniref:WD40-like Beta Propeller Repeat n=1 Tax=Ohtaekwangia koreensis TaxID=688867 RepID=A0A1T5M642_9BACT|nr:PD40 domain-containing protein [Ohtaekwangia koreensis]SKC83686.1 WD40-like Beta Propeller Repeat [Ohtaekwangia koreensis]